LVSAAGGRFVTLTDEQGRFEFPNVEGDSTLVSVARLGYADTEVTVELSRELTVVELERLPVELEGVSTGPGLSSAVEVARALDRRFAGFRGLTRSASVEAIRAYDGAHESDPYVMLFRELGIRWDFDEVGDVVRIDRYGRVRVEAFLDERQVSLRTVVLFPNAQLCHANLYTPNRALGPLRFREPTPQIRFYSCSYVARVMNGLASIPEKVCWGALFSGPNPKRRLGGCVTTSDAGATRDTNEATN
jgi:hypothetical protein